MVAIQSVLTELALRRVREVRWQWLLMLPLWSPFAIVVAQGILGFDLYRWFGAGWVAANVVFGIACTPLMVWLARRLDAGRDGIVGGCSTTSRVAACRMPWDDSMKSPLLKASYRFEISWYRYGVLRKVGA